VQADREQHSAEWIPNNGFLANGNKKASYRRHLPGARGVVKVGAKEQEHSGRLLAAPPFSKSNMIFLDACLPKVYLRCNHWSGIRLFFRLFEPETAEFLRLNGGVLNEIQEFNVGLYRRAGGAAFVPASVFASELGSNFGKRNRFDRRRYGRREGNDH
jgi:hypothetical protein